MVGSVLKYVISVSKAIFNLLYFPLKFSHFIFSNMKMKILFTPKSLRHLNQRFTCQKKEQKPIKNNFFTICQSNN
tara:strand:+ start:1413 stop:1637 length:225 start_codon:yes stop_codon:yes gene_type:complete